jgi:L,D-transpeptidase ErfK/SrfK
MTLNYRSLLKTQAFLSIFLWALVLFSGVAHAAYDEPTIGRLESMRTSYEDTLINLAQKQRVGYAQLIAANPGVDPWVPGRSTKIILPNWHIIPDVERKGLVLNTGELRLYYFPSDGSEPKTFPIGIGREGLFTPKGSTTVTRKQADPIWRPTPRMRLEDPELPAEVRKGPDNPLGAYALYMGWPSYLIHGTNKPKAIGRRASSGCIRMYDNEIEWLFHNVPVGTKVTSIDQPVKMAWIDGVFFIEAEPNDLQIDEIEYQNRQITVDVPDGIIAEVRRKAGDKVAMLDWEKVRNVLIERTGVPTNVTTKSVNVQIEAADGSTEVSSVEEVAAMDKQQAQSTGETKIRDTRKPVPANGVAKKVDAKDGTASAKKASNDWDTLNR